MTMTEYFTQKGGKTTEELKELFVAKFNEAKNPEIKYFADYGEDSGWKALKAVPTSVHVDHTYFGGPRYSGGSVIRDAKLGTLRPITKQIGVLGEKPVGYEWVK